VLLPFAAVAGVNIAFDPYRDLAYLLQRTAAPPRTVFNYAELKFKLGLAREIEGHRAIVLLGSSTTAGIDPDVGRLPTDVPVYNLAFSGADIYQVEAMARRLAQLTPKPRLIVGLDFFGANTQAAPDLLYLAADDEPARLDALRRLFAPVATFDWITGKVDGGLTFAPHGWRIFTRPRPVADDLDVGEATGRQYYGNFAIAPDYLDRLRRIAALAPDTRFFVSPVYRSHYAFVARRGLDGAYCDWVALLRKTVNVVDFSFMRETASAANFVDAEHYRPELGFRMLQAVLAPEPERAPFDRDACLAAFRRSTPHGVQAAS